MLAGSNRLRNIVPEVIADADKAVPGKPGLMLVAVQDLLMGKGKRPHCPRGKDTDAAKVRPLRAEPGNDLRCALNEKPHPFVPMDDRGHPLPVAIEEVLFGRAGLRPDLHIIEPVLPEPAEQCPFGRVADDDDLPLPLLKMCRPVHRGVERDPLGPRLREIRAVPGFAGRRLHDFHLVLRQGSGLVRADSRG